MGGFNSGGGRSAPRTHQFLDLDLASLKRLRMLRPGYSGTLTWTQGKRNIGSIGIWVRENSMLLTYRNKAYGRDWEDIQETIQLTCTPAGFGGSRKWFVCPSCRGRVRVLYGGRLYRCRKCRGATYESQYEPMFYASHARIRRLRKRLGGSGGDSWARTPNRPKGMHHTTYIHLCQEIWKEQRKMNVALSAYARNRGFKI